MQTPIPARGWAFCFVQGLSTHCAVGARRHPRITGMYKPQFASWFKALAEQMPGKAMPTKEQVELARELTDQPFHQGMVMSRMTAELLVHANQLRAAQKTRQGADLTAAGAVPGDADVALELMIAASWNREIVCPDPARASALIANPAVPEGALEALAALPDQTSYVVVDLMAPDTYVAGVWILKDIKPGTDDCIEVMVVPDLVTNGNPVRNICYTFPSSGDYDSAVEAFVSEHAQSTGPAVSTTHSKEGLRQFVSPSRLLLALAYDALVLQRHRLATLRQAAVRDELGFTLLNLSGERAELAGGMVH